MWHLSTCKTFNQLAYFFRADCAIRKADYAINNVNYAIFFSAILSLFYKVSG